MKKECSIVRDLLPLYIEDMVSENTAAFVGEHLKTCPSCQREYANMQTPTIGERFSVKQEDGVGFRKATRSLREKLRLLCAIPMLFALIFGTSLAVGFEPLANVIIMPIVGVLGYVIFRWKSVCVLPPLMLIVYGLVRLFRYLWLAEGMQAAEFFAMVGVYAVFVMVGILIAGLLHFAFKKEK